MNIRSINQLGEFHSGKTSWTYQDILSNLRFCTGLIKDAQSPRERTDLLREIIKWQLYLKRVSS